MKVSLTDTTKQEREHVSGSKQREVTRFQGEVMAQKACAKKWCLFNIYCIYIKFNIILCSPHNLISWITSLPLPKIKHLEPLNISNQDQAIHVIVWNRLEVCPRTIG